jgi:hypothetical protein
VSTIIFDTNSTPLNLIDKCSNGRVDFGSIMIYIITCSDVDVTFGAFVPLFWFRNRRCAIVPIKGLNSVEVRGFDLY